MTLVEETIKTFKFRQWAMGIALAKRTDMENAEIQFYVGFCREHGYGIDKNYAEAFDYYKKAAAQGHAKAMRNLAKMYEDGVWADANFEEAVEWYADAVANGDEVAKEALARLGHSVTNGRVVVECAKKAFDDEKWAKGIAAALSTDVSNHTLQMWLAYCYDLGKVVKKNADEAFRWCRKAAKGGNSWAMNKLGQMYESGKGTEKDVVEAFKWYESAAGEGHVEGLYNLGDMYEYGKGTKKNIAKAIELYRKAAAQGNEEAQRSLERIEAEAAAAEERDPIKALDAMIGLQSVKDQVKELIASVKVQKMREEHGLPKVEMAYHCVFTGNPGTGKTMVARLYAKILHKLGVIKTDKLVEVGRSEIVGGHLGETEVNVNDIVKKSLGGVLFIDEAYSLAQGDDNDYGKVAIDTLLKKIEDNRSRLVVILAGYEDKMDDLYELNAGMRSRFPYTIRFPDYSADELVEIFKFYARGKAYLPDGEALAAVRAEVEFELAKREEGFGNARFVRTLFEKTARNQSSRILMLRNPGRKELQRIVADDIPDDSGRNGRQETVDDILKEMDELVGLQPVKDDIRRLALYFQTQKRRKEEGLPVASDTSYHCVFTGNPGTGKTTVARYMARIYRALGVIRTTNLEEAGRSKLVGQYVGQTAAQTNKVIDAALNGVLFIDEAYSLAGSDENDFGHEAISTLLKRMEDDRDRLVVIVAGYTKEMKRFIEDNSGLQSRFSRTIEFPDYSADELFEVFMRLAQRGAYRLALEAEIAVKDHIKLMVANKNGNFGNARDVRNFFERVRERQGMRLALVQGAARAQLTEILPEDVHEEVVAGNGARANANSAVAVAGPCSCARPSGDARGCACRRPMKIVLDGEVLAFAKSWREVFLAVFRKLNDFEPVKFGELPDDPYFGKYFIRVVPGRRYAGYFQERFGLHADVRARELASKTYFERSDYYFLRLLSHLGVDAGRFSVE